MAVSLSEIKELLQQTVYPVAYQDFPKEKVPEMPYLCYNESTPNPFYADGEVYFLASHPEIRLYTKTKEPSAENRVENALSSFAWTKEENYLNEEKCYEILYEIEV